MTGPLRIAARHSDLARIQAQAVGRALERAHPGLSVVYGFRASLGDANLTDPLWKMPEKGVFTEDFVKDLVNGQADLVVHSWKDLPTEARARTDIISTVPRADGRDLMLMRTDAIDAARASGHLNILTSSPRRARNLDSFLRAALPFQTPQIVFTSVRGNVPTRIRKLFSDGADALIVAKAALDRLLDPGAGAEYADMRTELRSALDRCRWMVLPLSENPGAAGQGALAIEACRGREDLREILRAIDCPQTFAAATRERSILASYGGGCHQKIGVAVLPRPYGDVTFLRGVTDAGKVLDSAQIERAVSAPFGRVPRSIDSLYPVVDGEAGLFDREQLAPDVWIDQARAADALWIARENALPRGFMPSDRQLVWTAGAKTWKKLAARGIWVNGTADGLGETEAAGIEALAGRSVIWSKISHTQSEDVASAQERVIGTYRLKPRLGTGPDFRDKTHCFWMSGTAFDEAMRRAPHLRDGAVHACGPGRTAAHVARALGCDARGEPGRLSICLGPDHWRSLWHKRRDEMEQKNVLATP